MSKYPYLLVSARGALLTGARIGLLGSYKFLSQPIFKHSSSDLYLECVDHTMKCHIRDTSLSSEDHVVHMKSTYHGMDPSNPLVKWGTVLDETSGAYVEDTSIVVLPNIGKFNMDCVSVLCFSILQLLCIHI